MNLMKEFFCFTKSKLIVFILLSMASYYLMAQQDMVLGNFTWSIFLIFIVTSYLFLNILWFSFKDGKHFLIGLISFLLLFGILWLLGNYSAQKRTGAFNDCLRENNSTSFNTDVMRCMSTKGYRYYR